MLSSKNFHGSSTAYPSRDFKLPVIPKPSLYNPRTSSLLSNDPHKNQGDDKTHFPKIDFLYTRLKCGTKSSGAKEL